MILPTRTTPLTTEEQERQPSRTYNLDLTNNRVTGYIDGIESIKQFVFKQLQTDRFRYLIYSGNVGHEIQYGSGYGADLESHISDALTVDDRIFEINDFRSTVNGDEVVVSFTVVSIFGDVAIREVV